jgi:hypothetical protein
LGDVTQRARAVASNGGTPSPHGWLAVLRPETLALAARDDTTAWPGDVVACRFAGGSTVCHVRLAGAHVAELQTTARDIREGDRVGVRLVAGLVAMVPDRPEIEG